MVKFDELQNVTSEALPLVFQKKCSWRYTFGGQNPTKLPKIAQITIFNHELDIEIFTFDILRKKSTLQEIIQYKITIQNSINLRWHYGFSIIKSKIPLKFIQNLML